MFNREFNLFSRNIAHHLILSIICVKSRLVFVDILGFTLLYKIPLNLLTCLTVHLLIDVISDQVQLYTELK